MDWGVFWNLSNGLGVVWNQPKKGYLPDDRNPPLAPRYEFHSLSSVDRLRGGVEWYAFTIHDSEGEHRTEPGFAPIDRLRSQLANRLRSQSVQKIGLCRTIEIPLRRPDTNFIL